VAGNITARFWRSQRKPVSDTGFRQGETVEGVEQDRTGTGSSAPRAQQVEPPDAERCEQDSEHVPDGATAVRRSDDDQGDPDPEKRHRKKRSGSAMEAHAATLRPAATITRQGAFLRT
jgi:hypothetical protein